MTNNDVPSYLTRYPEARLFFEPEPGEDVWFVPGLGHWRGRGEIGQWVDKTGRPHDRFRGTPHAYVDICMLVGPMRVPEGL